MKNDPDQLNNLAGNQKYHEITKELSDKLMFKLKSTADPRVIGGGEAFDTYPYLAPYDLHKEP